MKKTHLLFIGLAIMVSLFTQNAQAKIWRVNNTSNYNGTTLWGDNLGGTSTFPVFAQLSDANSSNLVSNGTIDTIHIEGTNIVYNGVTITKPMIIIGTGYFLNENPKVSNTVSESETLAIYFYPGSSGSQLIGVHVASPNGILVFGGISNILIKRCLIDYSVTVQAGGTDISVVQNYFSNFQNSNTSAIFSSPNGFPSNFVFDNNICKRILLLTSGSSNYNAQQINNNVFDCPAISGNPSLQFNASECRNNIIKTPGVIVNVNGSNTNFTNNTSAATSQLLGTDPSDVNASNISGLFVASGTSDGKYMLNPSSPDYLPGFDGTERGAFGGAAVTSRYTLSGLANIPVIYSITTPGATSTNLPVTISARTIK